MKPRRKKFDDRPSTIRLYLTLLRLKNMNIPEKLKSRKLWAAVLGSAILTLGQGLGLPADISQWLVTIIVAYIAGQTVVDSVDAAVKK